VFLFSKICKFKQTI